MKIVTITAPTCSGKSTIESELERLGWHKVVSHTTRKPRVGEVHRRHYHFVGENFFDLNRHDFLEYLTFNGSYYGVHKDSLPKDGVAVIVCEPHGANQISAWCAAKGISMAKTYLDVPVRVQMQRFMERCKTELAHNPDSVKVLASRLQYMVEVESKWKDSLSDFLVYRMDVGEPRETALAFKKAIEHVLGET